MNKEKTEERNKTPPRYDGLPAVGGLSALRGVLREYFLSDEALLPCALAVNARELTLTGEAEGRKETRRIRFSRIGLPAPLSDRQAASLMSSLLAELTALPSLALDKDGRLVRKRE